MKKLMILAISAVLAMNVSAQEAKPGCKPDCRGQQVSKDERIAFDIKRHTNELMLSDSQAEKFAATYKEYAEKLDELFQKNAPAEQPEPGKELTDAELDQLAKQRFEGLKSLAELQAKYYQKFRKDLSARQVQKVMLNAPFGPKPCCKGHFEGPRPGGPKPEGCRHRGGERHCRQGGAQE